MKMWKSFSWVLGLCLTLSLFTSCLDDDDYSLGNFSMGVASVKAPMGVLPISGWTMEQPYGRQPAICQVL